jgi:hypothetical protein
MEIREAQLSFSRRDVWMEGQMERGLDFPMTADKEETAYLPRSRRCPVECGAMM